jgi:hypothetical protein
MENPEIKKNFISIIVVFFVFVAACITIVTCLTLIARADWSLGEGPDVGWYIGYSMSTTIGFGFSGAGIFLSIASLTVGVKKPELIKVFGIIIFVIFMVALGVMALGSALVSVAVAEVMDCALHNGSALWRANCTADIGYNSTILVCQIVMAGISIIGIVGSVKIVTIMNKTLPRPGFVSPQSMQQQPSVEQPSVAVAGSQGKFCSACGAKNADDAKFCKKCGKAC